MRRSVRLLGALALLLGTASAAAQVYKWVDDKGVVTYSGTPPARAGVKVDVVADRITVYSPDAALLQATKAARQRSDQGLMERIERLERDLQAARRSRQYAAAAEASAAAYAYERCRAERRVDCDGYSDYAPHAPVVVTTAFRQRQQAFIPSVSLAGVTAGNVAASVRSAGGRANLTPGAMPDDWVANRPVRAASLSRGFRSR